MLIGIDGNEANVPDRVGIGRYAFELLKQLSQKQNTKFTVYLKDDPSQDLPIERDWWKYKVVHPKPFWTQTSLPLSLYFGKERPDAFFSPTHYGPRFSPVPTFISIMDLSFVHFPELFTQKDLHQLRHWTHYSVKNARRVFTISHFSKRDIVAVYGIPPEKITVTYPGYDKDKFKIQKPKFKIKRLKDELGIKPDYFLFVGTLQPRKNILSLIAAFDQLLRSRALTKTTQLVIVGKKGWLYQGIFAEVTKRHLQNDVVFTDYISDNELAALYQGAICFVLPSLYEGFGLTVVEAMASGCPVVVSNTSCLPEIVGDAGRLVDPTRTDSIASGISEVVGWKKDRREKIIAQGLTQVKKFAWDKCAELTLESILETV